MQVEIVWSKPMSIPFYYSEESRTTVCRPANPLPEEGKSGGFKKRAKVLLTIFFLNKIE